MLRRDRPTRQADATGSYANNNLAKRELRLLVIARKISFSSQPYVAARTGEILLTVLHTLKKRTPDVVATLRSALNKLAEQPQADPAKLLFSLDSS